MSRALTLGFGIALVLLAVGLLAPASPVAVPLVIVAGIIFAGIVFAIFGSAWRTKGWSLRHPGRRL
jgi:hypothetical protein